MLQSAIYINLCLNNKSLINVVKKRKKILKISQVFTIREALD